MESPNSEIPEIVRAYAAGLLDGEGCIHIARRHYLPTRRDHFVVQVIVANNNRGILEWLHGLWGGYVVAASRSKTPRPNWRPGWAWRLQGGRHAGPFLRAIEPHVRMKSSLVSVALDLIEFQAAHNKHYGRNPLPEVVYQHQVELHARHRQLMSGLGLGRTRLPAPS